MNPIIRKAAIAGLGLLVISSFVSCASGRAKQYPNRGGYASKYPSAAQSSYDEKEQFETAYINDGESGPATDQYDPNYPDPHDTGSSAHSPGRNAGQMEQAYHAGSDHNPPVVAAPVPVKSKETCAYQKESYFQTGVASWYGREFQGKKTASGEPFDMSQLTAAHKTLPFGTLVEIKNFDNGRTVQARINDRGPYYGDRVIDVSYEAAKHLDIVQTGQAMVGIRVLKEGQGQAKSPGYRTPGAVTPVVDNHTHQYDHSDESRSMGMISIQVGAFYSKRNAMLLQQRIEGLTHSPVQVIQENDLYKVRIQGIRTSDEAYRLKMVLNDEDIPAYLIKR